MASMRQLQPASRNNTTNGLSLGNSRNTSISKFNNDPLQPLKAMADRVGKEVDKFAEQVDQWYTQGNETAKSKHKATLQLVNKFKAVADTTVRELKKQSGAENKGELQKSVMRRIEGMKVSKEDEESNRESQLAPVEPDSIPESTRVQDLRHWQTEAATWDLLRIIIEHYHPEPGTDPEAVRRSRLAKLEKQTPHSSNTEIWDRFLLEDDGAKEKALIIRWLQDSASNTESDIESITQQLEQQSGKSTATWTSGWLDTKSRIKHAKRMKGSDGPLDANVDLPGDDKKRLLVTQLDPDAPRRQRKDLAEADQYYEKALWMVCYEMLRRGVPMSELSDWCKAKSEEWRAVSTGASSQPQKDGAPNLSGPTVGFLFRRTCLFAAEGSNSQYQAAVYGMLSGHHKRVEPVCRSWDDHLYARYNALLLSRFDTYLIKNHGNKVPPTLATKFQFKDAVAELGDWNTSPRRVVDLLREQRSTAALSLLPMKLIQGSLISRNIAELISEVGEAIVLLLQADKRPTNIIIDPQSDPEHAKSFIPDTPRVLKTQPHHQTLAADPNALRILVHILIVLRNGLGMVDRVTATDWATPENVLCAYIEFLRTSRRYLLIPIYAAQLSEVRAEHCLSRILPDINNPDEQKSIVHLLFQYNLDPAEIVAQAYEQVSTREFGRDKSQHITRFQMLDYDSHTSDMWPGYRVMPSFAGSELDRRDEALIESLRWVPHLKEDVTVTFEILHSGLMHLLLNGRIGAAETLTSELSLDSISLIKTRALCGYGFDIMAVGAEEQDEEELTQAAREELSSSGRGSLQPSRLPSAIEHYEHVMELRQAAQTYYELQQLVRLVALFREWRAEEDFVIAQRRARAPKVSLKKARDIYENIETTMEPLLDSFLAGFEPGSRTEADAWTIREAYIPEVILAFISASLTMGYFTTREVPAKAMDIATIIADEEHAWLQEVFLKTNRLKELLDALAKVSKQMLRLGEPDIKGRSSGKKPKKGEDVKIWDVNVKN